MHTCLASLYATATCTLPLARPLYVLRFRARCTLSISSPAAAAAAAVPPASGIPSEVLVGRPGLAGRPRPRLPANVCCSPGLSGHPSARAAIHTQDAATTSETRSRQGVTIAPAGRGVLGLAVLNRDARCDASRRARPQPAAEAAAASAPAPGMPRTQGGRCGDAAALTACPRGPRTIWAAAGCPARRPTDGRRGRPRSLAGGLGPERGESTLAADGRGRRWRGWTTAGRVAVGRLPPASPAWAATRPPHFQQNHVIRELGPSISASCPRVYTRAACNSAWRTGYSSSGSSWTTPTIASATRGSCEAAGLACGCSRTEDAAARTAALAAILSMRPSSISPLPSGAVGVLLRSVSDGVPSTTGRLDDLLRSRSCAPALFWGRACLLAAVPSRGARATCAGTRTPEGSSRARARARARTPRAHVP